MSNVRETILDNLKNGLANINNENGYTTNIKQVIRSPVPTGFSFSGEETPALLITDKDETLIVENIADYTIMEMNITIEGHLKNKTNIKTDFNQLISDIRKYIASASLGDNVHFARDGNFGILWGKDGVMFTMELMIRYYYPKDDP